jgi:endo-1,4-beta-D-glucanase Y
MTVNPFEEANSLRLEQSVLSPNLFHVASTSTPERESGKSLWNIDQRAVLFPADIPTDENSLLAQYIYDELHNSQMNAAVEAFWSQNQVHIYIYSFITGVD